MTNVLDNGNSHFFWMISTLDFQPCDIPQGGRGGSKRASWLLTSISRGWYHSSDLSNMYSELSLLTTRRSYLKIYVNLHTFVHKTMCDHMITYRFVNKSWPLRYVILNVKFLSIFYTLIFELCPKNFSKVNANRTWMKLSQLYFL